MEGKKPKHPLPHNILNRCRELRQSSTNAEQRLWKFLRNKQLGGFKFRRQHPLGPFILDFYCMEAKLAIELDGSGHADKSKRCYDAERSDRIANKGIQVLRFWNQDVLQNTEEVLQLIWSHLQDFPHPNPLPEGEGD